MTAISLEDMRQLLGDAVIKAIHTDGCDLYLGLAHEDARRWALIHERDGEIDTDADPVALLRRYLEKP